MKGLYTNIIEFNDQRIAQVIERVCDNITRIRSQEDNNSPDSLVSRSELRRFVDIPVKGRNFAIRLASKIEELEDADLEINLRQSFDSFKDLVNSDEAFIISKREEISEIEKVMKIISEANHNNLDFGKRVKFEKGSMIPRQILGALKEEGKDEFKRFIIQKFDQMSYFDLEGYVHPGQMIFLVK